MIKAALGLSVLLAALTAGLPQANATLRVCNATTFKITTAIGRNDPPNGWISEGWWITEPGGCTEIINTPLHERYYYLYAESLGQQPRKTFAGSMRFCIQRTRFKLKQAEYGDNTRAECSAAGLEAGSFFQVDTGDSRNHTVRLTNDSGDDAPVRQSGAVPPPAFATPSPQPAPASGGTACQRFPNLC